MIEVLGVQTHEVATWAGKWWSVYLLTTVFQLGNRPVLLSHN